MSRSLRIQLAVGILSAASWQLYGAGRQSDRGERQQVVIRVYDLSGVSARDLQQAAEEAGRILATAGVDPVWQFGAADAAEAHQIDWSANSPGSANRHSAVRDYLVLTVTRNFPERSLPGALGFSLPNSNYGVQATVFYDRIERAMAGNLPVATMLGHAMAHELGHVLLGNTEHSATGIMKARWGGADYRRAGMGLMTFSSLEREAIQKRAVLRLSAETRN
jgi:hypothetical protein